VSHLGGILNGIGDDRLGTVQAVLVPGLQSPSSIALLNILVIRSRLPLHASGYVGIIVNPSSVGRILRRRRDGRCGRLSRLLDRDMKGTQLPVKSTLLRNSMVILQGNS
jgi:hypothetical protein